MELVDQWEEIGEKRGVAVGEANIVVRQLRRLGQVSLKLESRIRALPLAAIEAMADTLPTFSSVAEADTWIDRKSPESPAK